MNWKLIFGLSILGMIMGIASVFWLSFSIEPFFWIVVFILSAYLIAKYAPGKYFMHGFLVALVNCIWVTAAQVINFDTYVYNHPELHAMNAQMPWPDHPKRMMVLMAPLIGALSGVILGLFSYIAAKIMKRPKAIVG